MAKKNFEKDHTQLINKTDKKFIDISSEAYREYTFLSDSGKKVKERINQPLKLHVSESGGHRIFTEDGRGHYIPFKWIHIEWIPKKRKAHFVA